MSIDNETVKKIAKLARINVTDDEVKNTADQLTKIFDWIEQLQEVNTDNVPEMAGVGNYTLRSRKDEISTNGTGGNIQDKVLSNSPAKEFGCYVVPKVVE